MARGHPVDEFGRVLPDSSWPADRAAPERWDLIRRFCNTCNRESGADRFHTGEGLRDWLHSEAISDATPNPAERCRIVKFREHVRAHALAHHGSADDAELRASLADEVEGLELAMTATDGRLAVTPTSIGVADQVIGAIAIAIMDAQHAGVWKRFKACRSCEWVFYDRSKNQSGRWCSMSACGGRAKVAAFRRRERTLSDEL